MMRCAVVLIVVVALALSAQADRPEFKKTRGKPDFVKEKQEKHFQLLKGVCLLLAIRRQ